jgi:hypothetical protein
MGKYYMGKDKGNDVDMRSGARERDFSLIIKP